MHQMILPDNANLTELAFKMCQTELNYRKNLEKGIVTQNPNPPMAQQQPQAVSSSTSSPILVKSVSEINKTVSHSSIGSGQILHQQIHLQASPQQPRYRVDQAREQSHAQIKISQALRQVSAVFTFTIVVAVNE